MEHINVEGVLIDGTRWLRYDYDADFDKKDFLTLSNSPYATVNKGFGALISILKDLQQLQNF